MNRFLFTLAAVLSAIPLTAQPLLLRLDPAETQVAFTLGDVLHTVHGVFRLKSGNLQIDPAAHTAAGSLVVDAASGDSDSNGRDSRMHKNILESAKFPEITFVPDRVIGTVNLDGSSDVQLHGKFTLHGTAHEVTLPIHAEAAHGQIKATTKFPVPYVKWGLKNPSTLMLRVKDTVEIEIHTAGQIGPANS